MFFVLGGGGSVFLILWFIFAPRSDQKPPGPAASAHGGPTYLDILRSGDAWGSFLGACCYNYAYFFGLTWLPSYLVQQKHLSLEKMGVLGAACMSSPSKSWEPKQRPHPWHSRAGGGAVHSITNGSEPQQ